MKYDIQKAFPYPVLLPYSNDYTDSEFQTTVDIQINNNDDIKINIEYAISSEDIANQVLVGNARFASIISCRDTYTREMIETNENVAEISFNATSFRGEVRVDSFVVAKEEIVDYQPSDINSEFGSNSFSFYKGAVLAQDEPQVFYLERDYFKPVTSVFELVKKNDLAEGEWSISFNQDHVQIEVNPNTYEIIHDARNSKKNKIILLNSIYFAAVMQSIQILKDSPEEFENYKWANIITRQAHNNDLNLESMDAYLIAEKLMNNPFSKLCSMFVRGDNL